MRSIGWLAVGDRAVKIDVVAAGTEAGCKTWNIVTLYESWDLPGALYDAFGCTILQEITLVGLQGLFVAVFSCSTASTELTIGNLG